ncbi:MAG: Slp family lipoprotein [Candidatus Schekmanbacteria bacterium]|nr:Slp family lipoprotein [Candidatus Schekmanbacteria bacterium]
MKKTLIFLIIPLVLLSCTSVLKKELMLAGTRELPLQAIKENPDFYKGKLFILGGIVANTKFSEEGSVIEAAYVPVDERGNFSSSKPTNTRFLAVLSKDKGLIDPLIYRQGKEVTLAGRFIEVRKNKIEEMEYSYPVFSIEEIYAWEEKVENTNYATPMYPSWYYPYWGGYPYWGYDYYRSPVVIIQKGKKNK